ncbi:IS3 family transposase [Methylobacterium fujisawaense]|nr:IS3 family transposase [Methylobacterium pseudosasicola]
MGFARTKRALHDNAIAESFFSTLACELLYCRRLRSQPEVRMAVFNYFEGFYNPLRLPSVLGYCSPIAFEQKIELDRSSSTLIEQAPLTVHRTGAIPVQRVGTGSADCVHREAAVGQQGVQHTPMCTRRRIRRLEARGRAVAGGTPWGFFVVRSKSWRRRRDRAVGAPPVATHRRPSPGCGVASRNGARPACGRGRSASQSMHRTFEERRRDFVVLAWPVSPPLPPSRYDGCSALARPRA